MAGINDEIEKDVQDTNESTSSPIQDDMDELDRILAGYQQPKTETEKPSEKEPQKLPFISHDPTQGQKQEYFVRGPKKGQPKPPKKGKAPATNEAGQLSIEATTFITGAIFITMIDLMIPLFIAGIYNWMNRKKKGGQVMDYEKMKMTTSQRNDLSPVADAVVRELKISGSPTILFLVGLAGVYFMNFILNKSSLEKNQSNEKDNSSAVKNSNRPVNNIGNP